MSRTRSALGSCRSGPGKQLVKRQRRRAWISARWDRSALEAGPFPWQERTRGPVPASTSSVLRPLHRGADTRHSAGPPSPAAPPTAPGGRQQARVAASAPPRSRFSERGSAARQTDGGQKCSERPGVGRARPSILEVWPRTLRAVDPAHPLDAVVGAVRGRLRPAASQGPGSPYGNAEPDRPFVHSGVLGSRRSSIKLASSQKAVTIATPSAAPRTRFATGPMRIDSA